MAQVEYHCNKTGATLILEIVYLLKFRESDTSETKENLNAISQYLKALNFSFLFLKQLSTGKKYLFSI